MSTINNSIDHGITLSVLGSYTSPLTVTSTGTISNAGTGDAVYGPDTQAWTVYNAGQIAASGTQNSGITMLAGGYVNNSGWIVGGHDGIDIGGAPGAIVNSNTIQASGAAKTDNAIDLGNAGYAGYISNAAAGLVVAAGGDGIFSNGLLTSIINAGTVRSTQDYGV